MQNPAVQPTLRQKDVIQYYGELICTDSFTSSMSPDLSAIRQRRSIWNSCKTTRDPVDMVTSIYSAAGQRFTNVPSCTYTIAGISSTEKQTSTKLSGVVGVGEGEREELQWSGIMRPKHEVKAKVNFLWSFLTDSLLEQYARTSYTTPDGRSYVFKKQTAISRILCCVTVWLRPPRVIVSTSVPSLP